MATIPVNDDTPRAQYTATAGQTDFTYDWFIFNDAGLTVYVDDAVVDLGAGADYTVTGAGTEDGGLVVFNAGLTGGEIVTIEGATAIERVADLQQAGKFDPDDYNLEQDRNIVIMKELRRDIDRKLGLVTTSTGSLVDLELALTTVFADIANVNIVAADLDGADTIGIVAADLSGADTIGAVAAIDAEVVVVAGISANVTTVAGISANVTSVAGIAADVTAAAANAANINIVATNLGGADTIGAVAAIDAEVSTVAGISAEIIAVAANETNINIVAGMGYLYSNNPSSGVQTEAFGNGAGDALTSAPYTTLFGYRAGYKLTSAFANTAFGAGALDNSVSQSYNTAVGYNAFGGLSGGSGSSVAVGAVAASNRQTSTQEVLVGYEVAGGTSNGTGNVMIGYRSGYATDNSNYNVFIGYNVAYNASTNNSNHRNIIIGDNIPLPGAATTDYLNIGELLVGGIHDAATKYLDVLGELRVNSAYTLPTVDGAGGQVLQTNGAGDVAWGDALAVPVNQCRLTKSGSNLLLSRYGGKYITIGGALRELPEAGVTLAPSGATINTDYNIYAYMSGSTITLEYSTTAWAIDTATGMKIKSGDATRSFYGKARAVTGPVWVDTDVQRFVVSEYNQKDVRGVDTFSTTRSTTSTSFVEINSEIRCEFLAIEAMAIDAHLAGNYANNTLSGGVFVYIGLNGTGGVNGLTTYQQAVANLAQPMVNSANPSVAEGYNYLTIVGRVDGGTASFNANSTLQYKMRG